MSTSPAGWLADCDVVAAFPSAVLCYAVGLVVVPNRPREAKHCAKAAAMHALRARFLPIANVFVAVRALLFSMPVRCMTRVFVCARICSAMLDLFGVAFFVGTPCATAMQCVWHGGWRGYGGEGALCQNPTGCELLLVVIAVRLVQLYSCTTHTLTKNAP